VARPILNLSELEFRDHGHGERFQAKLGAIGVKIGAQKLGYNLTVLPPGKRAFPLHHHRVNEEMFFVLEGEGEVRFGPERYPIKQGDFIACPPGGAEHAHQIVNTSSAELRYLAVSTKLTPELVEYPDTGKFGIMAEVMKPGEAKPEIFRFVGRPDVQVDYWEGE
jgi:uncharacterized cupin superfamily protein